jgi:hypothetical protein
MSSPFMVLLHGYANWGLSTFVEILKEMELINILASKFAEERGTFRLLVLQNSGRLFVDLLFFF